jgi:hypothetical protein
MGQMIQGLCQWQHFRRFLSILDFWADVKKKQEKDPLWKVRVFINHLNKNAKDMWVPGKWVAIYEQTIGFQGASGMKLHISCKREGDGFQCDAVCDHGYTYSSWFRHGNPPDLGLGPEFKHLDLAPMAWKDTKYCE